MKFVSKHAAYGTLVQSRSGQSMSDGGCARVFLNHKDVQLLLEWNFGALPKGTEPKSRMKSSVSWR